jgi:translation initiation factor 3 subunit L
MSVRQAPAYQPAASAQHRDDDSDEEALANDYREQVGYQEGHQEDFDSAGGAQQDLHAQLQQAATPLEYGATLETKMQSYDSYCNLFHFILNSDGPVDIEVPSVSLSGTKGWLESAWADREVESSISGRGMSLTSSSTNSTHSAHTDKRPL